LVIQNNKRKVLNMKKIFGFAVIFMFTTTLTAQNLSPIKLNAPSKTRGGAVMTALSDRKSSNEFSEKKLSLQDLSDLFWAANGINREDGKKTAASAMNKQDVDVYAFMEEGVYLYDAVAHELKPVASGDHRKLFGERGASPLCLLMVSDISRFGTVGSEELRKEWGAIDIGLVSQNIALFCSGCGLATKPRAGMDREGLKKVLKLSDTQLPMLNNPVGYPK